tara:strand:- start:1547 stop:1978 length:432 start_codon:yes stop_codon:yes gene_type:complete
MSRKLTRRLVACLAFLLFCTVAKADDVVDVFTDLNQRKADYFTNAWKDAKGTELKAVRFKFEDRYISFQYQHWKVRHKSICSDIKNDILEFSKCSQAASRMFNWLCVEYGNDTNNVRMQQGKRMYCNAAIDYKPVVAEISRPE